MTTVNTNQISKELMDAMNGTKTKKSVAEEAQDRFMTLLVTQMKNQDPLNPLDNAQVTSQLAQLSTVTGIDKLNGTLESLMGSYQTSQAMQSANLIGHGVLAPGNSIDLVDGKALLGLELNQEVDSAQLIIKDAAGKEVQSIPLDDIEVGSQPLTWDGTLADGTKAVDGRYTFEIKATSAGKAVDVTELQFGLVATVTTSSTGSKINVPGLGPINFADIRQIL